ncbi:hypothetical protein PB1_17134 [Bacillus methanolicus PB1]|uniref:Uncharacterized protein n=1 Tax=Bacillus methanolicus PB1 TaxID=997296 RepID=I3DYI1_BACMT|nr:hypothetical protein PB1_17134 [Bacillus methanolicus PB1]
MAEGCYFAFYWTCGILAAIIGIYEEKRLDRVR